MNSTSPRAPRRTDKGHSTYLVDSAREGRGGAHVAAGTTTGRARRRRARRDRACGPTQRDSGAGGAGSAPIGGPAHAAGCRPREPQHTRSCAGRRSSGRSRGLYSRRARAARRRSPTAEPRKTVRQHAAREEIPELLLHEFRQPVAVGVLRRRVQEPFQVLVDHAVQHAVLGNAGLIPGKAVGPRRRRRRSLRSLTIAAKAIRGTRGSGKA